MKDQSRMMNRLIQENIAPFKTAGKNPDAARLYSVSEKIKRAMRDWIIKVGLDEINRITLLRKPKDIYHAMDLINKHVDNISNLERLEDILEEINDNRQGKAWNLILK